MAKNIIVVGGSLCGLFTGIALRRLGHTVRILERNPTPLLHDQGAGVVAGDETQGFFTTYDLTKTPLVVTSHARRYLDKEGNIIDHEERPQQMTSWDLLYHLLRANFDRTKSEYCDPPAVQKGEGPGSYEYGSTVTAIHDQGLEGISVTVKKVSGDNEETLQGDMLIACDGASSSIRAQLLSDVKRTYAGYVAWRGTCPESSLSASATDAFSEKFTFYHTQGIQILTYLIPGKNGTLKAGERLLNWVWYCNYADGSEELEELMTDSDGRRHPVTLPPGKMNPSVWSKQKAYAREVLPPQFAEAVNKTEVPFIQAITDVLSPQASSMDGKVLLCGDALAGFRPHTAASTSQAAYDAQMVARLVKGEIDLKEWEEQVMQYARNVQGFGVRIGQRSQFGEHPLSS